MILSEAEKNRIRGLQRNASVIKGNLLTEWAEVLKAIPQSIKNKVKETGKNLKTEWEAYVKGERGLLPGDQTEIKQAAKDFGAWVLKGKQGVKEAKALQEKRILRKKERTIKISKNGQVMRISESQFKRIAKSVLNEQVDDWLEKSYVKPSIESGYTEVDKIDLPDGIYYKSGGGYSVIVQDEGGYDLGYEVITNSGIRGMWSGQEFEISGGKPELDVYKILFKKN